MTSPIYLKLTTFLELKVLPIRAETFASREGWSSGDIRSYYRHKIHIQLVGTETHIPLSCDAIVQIYYYYMGKTKTGLLKINYNFAPVTHLTSLLFVLHQR